MKAEGSATARSDESIVGAPPSSWNLHWEVVAMRKIAVAVALSLAVLPAIAAETTGGAADNPMASWKPPKVTREAQDKKEIGALWKAMQAAEKAGDVNAAADLVDYPVMMMTDNAKGDGMGEPWSREKWIQVMEPFYKHPQPDMNATHKTNIFLMSDSLASVDDVCTMKMKGRPVTVRNSTLLIKKDGKWLVKAMAEGGWGDMVASGPATAGQGESGGSSGAAQGAAPSGSDTGSGTGTTSGTGTGTGTGSTSGMGTSTGSSSGTSTGSSSGAGTGSSPGAGQSTGSSQQSESTTK